MKLLRFGTLCLGLALLAACGTVQPTPSVESRIISEEALSGYLSDMGQDIQELISESDLNLAFLQGLPAGGPLSLDMTNLVQFDLQQAANLEAITSMLKGEKTLSLLSHGEADYRLSRGYWHYNLEEANWVLSHDSDDLVLDFYFNNLDGTVSHIIITLDWDALAPTVLAMDGSGMSYEVPEGLKLSMLKDGISAGYLDVRTSWNQDCSERALEPSMVMVKGHFQHEGSADHLMIDLKVMTADNETSHDTLSSSATVNFTSSQGHVELGWYLKEELTFVRDTGCILEAIEVYKGWLDADLKVDYEGEASKLAVMLEHGAISGEAIHDVKGRIKVDHKEVANFHGKLDDANENGVPGENLELAYYDGSTSTLEALLLDLEYDYPLPF